MTRLLPDWAFHATPRLAVDAAAEEQAYVTLRPADAATRRETLAVIDVNPASATYGRLELTHANDEFGDDRLVASHPAHGALVTSEPSPHIVLGQPLDLDHVRAGQLASRLELRDTTGHHQVRAIGLGADSHIVLTVRAANNPTRAFGFAGVAVSGADLSSSVLLWYLDRAGGGALGEWKARRIIVVPPEPAEPHVLPPSLRRVRAVPPLLSDVALSGDDRFLYVACWGTGELRQYDVSDPFNPVLTGAVRLGGMVRRASHPAAPLRSLTGGPQSIAVSHDGRRVYVTNSISAAWDAQFYPAGLRGWVAKLDVGRAGGLTVDPGFFVGFDDDVVPCSVRLTRLRAPSPASTRERA